MAADDLTHNMEKLSVEDDYETYKLGDFKLKSGGEIQMHSLHTKLSVIPLCQQSSIQAGTLAVRIIHPVLTSTDNSQ